MAIETKSFVIDHVQMRYKNSSVLTGNRNPSKPVIDGVNEMSVQCKMCGTAWHATPGSDRGQFQNIVGSVRISCHQCDAEGSVPKKDLKQS